MTKEQEAYASTLNLLGSDVLDPRPEGGDWELVDTLARERRLAVHSTGPHADCPLCYWTVPYGGPLDGEHFADLWEHLIVRHRRDLFNAETLARTSWKCAPFKGAMAA